MSLEGSKEYNQLYRFFKQKPTYDERFAHYCDIMYMQTIQ